MTELLNSDEDKYANESFENDTDEIPEVSEVSETESGSENEPTAVPSNSTLYAYARNRFQGRKNSIKNRNCVPYDSSSEDDEDVVISETIVEINTEPMCMDDAMLNSARLPIQPGLFVRPSSSGLPIGKMRLPPKEPLAITEIPNQPSPHVSEEENAEDQDDNDDNDDDNEDYEDNEANEDNEDNEDNDDDDEHDYDDEVSDNENAAADVTPINENELLNQFNHLSCVQNEMTKASANAGDEIMLECTQSRVLRSKNTIGDGPDANRSNLNTALADKYQKNGDFSDVDNASNCPPKELNNELYEYEKEPSIDVRITSETPTSFNTDDYAFHLNFLKQNGSNDKLKARPQQRKSWSFSNDRMREIERHNHILLRKILSQKPTYHLNTPKPTKFSTLPPTTRVTSAAINRKKKQRQIDLDNQGLKRRIEAISLRRPGQQHFN